jgi:two-component system NarL family sensor kinase
VSTDPAAAPPEQAVPWTVVSPGRAPDPPDLPVSWRRIVVQALVATLVVFAAVAIGGTVTARRTAERESVNAALQVTDVLATSVVEPVLADDLLSTDRATAAAARDRLDVVVRAQVLGGGLMRVKLWTPDGRIVYSDEPLLVGEVFPLRADEQEAIRTPSTQAEISDLELPENRFETGERKLLEVYRPVWTPNRAVLLFETYSRYDVVTTRSGQLWRGFAGITLSSLLLLLLFIGPLMWALVTRIRRSQQQRDVLRDRAVSATEQERRRIAATLHDGVVQELAGVSFVVAGAADRARAAGDEPLATRLSSAAGTVRASIGGLRSLLVDIYPAALREAGLAPALNDLAGTLRSRGIAVAVELPDGLDLPPETEALVFRVAQEVLRNTARHAGARTVTVHLRQVEGVLLLDITDDGAGFDPAAALATPPEGHLGMRLLADAAAEAGAELSVASAPGRGTRWRLEVPAR